jgi:hypothetical protein
MPITPPPQPPQRTEDEVTFNAKAIAWLDWQYNSAAEFNALEANAANSAAAANTSASAASTSASNAAASAAAASTSASNASTSASNASTSASNAAASAAAASASASNAANSAAAAAQSVLDASNAAAFETVSQAEAEAGTSTTRRAWTAQRVAQAIAAQASGAAPNTAFRDVVNTFTARQIINVSAGGGIANANGHVSQLDIANGSDNASAAMLSFHRGLQFACYFGLDIDNKLKVGGWSMGNNAYEIYHAGNLHTVTIGSASKTLVNRERHTVTTGGLTITLPANPQPGWEVSITVLAFTNTIIGRNGQNIMGLAANMTINRANVTVTLLFVDASRGWRII